LTCFSNILSNADIFTLIFLRKWGLETPCRNYKIAGNVLDNLYTTYGDEKCAMCLSAAETLFISIDWFAKCMAIRQSQGAKGTYNDHLICYERHRERVKYVLVNEQYYGHEEDVLRVIYH
jgi:hypothetical protein